MTWIIDNWLVILLGVGFVAFHLFGHGGHGGGHGGGHKHGSDADPTAPPADAKPTAPSDVPSVPDADAAAAKDTPNPPKTGGHQH